MVIKWMPLALLLLPLQAHAGDCLYHPVFIHEIEIGKCIVVSEASAGSISIVAPPKIVAARYPGLILEGTQTGIRQIDVDGPSEGIKAHFWEKSNEATRFLYQGKSANECKSFPAGKKVKLFGNTNCGCDTGPAPDGYCALTVDQVTEVPKDFAKYLE